MIRLRNVVGLLLLSLLASAAPAREPSLAESQTVQESLRYLPPNIRSYYLDKAGIDMWPAAQPRPESSGLRLVGKWGGGPSVRVTGRDSIVYLSRGSEVVVINYADTANPRVLTSIQAPGLIARSILIGNRLYISSGYIETFDISDPANPVKLGSLFARAPAIDIVDTLVYTVYRDSFKVFNFANPADPVMLGACRDSGYDLSVCNGYAYIGDRWGLYVLDVTNPSSPRRIASWGSDVISVKARSNICCATLGDPNQPDYLKFYVLDTRQPASIAPLGSLDNCGGYDLYLDDSMVFISGYYTGGHVFRILDISDSTRPTHVGSTPTPGEHMGVWVNRTANRAYVADRFKGITLVDITDPVHPAVDTSLLGAGTAVDICVDGSRAYVAGIAAGMAILDISTPSQPVELSHIDSTRNMVDLAVAARDSFAYMGWQNRPLLRSIDVSDPMNPQKAGSANVTNDPVDMVLCDSFLYVAEDNKFQVVNVARPRQPVVVGTCGLQFNTYGMCLVDTLAYVASYPFAIINVKNPATPVVVGTIARGAWNGSVRDTFLFLSSGGVLVYSVADPTLPRLLDSLSLGPNTAWVEAIGSLLYTGHRDGVRVTDADDVHNMRLRGFAATPYTVNRLCCSAPYVYAACYDAGVCIFESTVVAVEEQEPKVGQRPKTVPTVVRGAGWMNQPEPGIVMDAAGRRVAEIGPGRARRNLAPGVYFVRETQAQAQAQARTIRKVVVVR